MDWAKPCRFLKGSICPVIFTFIIVFRLSLPSHSALRSALNETLMNLIFEWDEDKARRNEAKHGVSFHEGKTVFNDPFAVTVPDPDHSEHEDRWLDIGFTSRGRLVVVWYTERNDRIRIIGCRKATRDERSCYRK